MTDTHEIPIIVSSDVAEGAQNKSADGSSFEVNLEDPIRIPTNASSVDIIVQEATIWWVIPNIITGVNDTFYIEHLTIPYVAVLPQGLYDLSCLQSATEREVVAAGAPAGLFNFIPDQATQKVVLQINQAGTQIDFTPADTFRDILGFDSQLVPVAPSVGFFAQVADNTAAFNTIDFFLIHSDIVPRGIRLNNTYSQTIAQVLIDTPPGSQIVSRPFNPPPSPAWDLIGAIRKRVKFWLTDNNNNLVNTNNENWSARLLIKYTVPVGENAGVES